MAKVLTLLILAFVAILGSADDGFDFNSFLDQILGDTLEKNKDQIEPFNVPDIRRGFDRKIGFVRVHGQVALENIKLHGLTTLRRAGHSTMSKTEDGSTRIAVHMAIGELSYEGYAKAQFIGIGPNRRFTGGVKYAQVEVSILLSSQGQPKLETLSINKLDGVEHQFYPKFTPLNVAVNLGIKGAFKFLDGSVKNIIENVGRKVMGQVLQNPKFMEILGSQDD